MAFWAHAPWPILLLATLVVVGEHLSNQVYQYALINHRYAPMLVVVTVLECLVGALCAAGVVT